MNVYQIVTDQIIEKLRDGTVPWRKTWTSSGLPKSLSTNKNYRGINILLLSLATQEGGYTSPFWGTYKHIAKLGGQVRKGEKGTLVTFWKRIKRTETNEATGQTETKWIPLLRYYKLFNADQADGLPERYYANKVVAEPKEALEAAEAIAGSYLEAGPHFTNGRDGRAWYSPSQDLVSVPERNDFDSSEAYYSTLFHELGHSTGHESRLARPGVTESHFFGDETYSKEELVAELTAAFLCAASGIEQVTLANSASYIDNWIGVLKGDTKLVVQAAAQAQKAADLIQGISYEVEQKEKVAA